MKERSQDAADLAMALSELSREDLEIYALVSGMGLCQIVLTLGGDMLEVTGTGIPRDKMMELSMRIRKRVSELQLQRN